VTGTEAAAGNSPLLKSAPTDRPPAACRLCGADDFELFLTIPELPPTGQFLTHAVDDLAPELAPLSLWQCDRCRLVQHDGGYPEGYYDAYFISYRSSDLARSYQQDLARRFVSRFDLEGQPVVDVGCGDGLFLSALGEAGAQPIGYERSGRAAEILRAEGHTILDGDLVQATRSLPEPPAAVTTRHVLEHIDDLEAFLGSLRQSVAPGGAVLIEVPALEQTVHGRRVYDFIPDHLSYFTAATLGLALERAGFRSVEVQRIVGGEFLVATATAPADDLTPADWVAASPLGPFLADQMAAGRSVALWGAGPKGLGLVNETGGRGIRCVVDSDALKQGRFTPTRRVPIVSPEAYIADPTDVVVITVWTYRDEIARQLADLGYGGQILWVGPDGVTPVPAPGRPASGTA